MFFLPFIFGGFSCLPKGYFLLSKSDGNQKAKSGAKNTLCTQRKIFRSNAMDDLVLNNTPALPSETGYSAAARQAKEICYIKRGNGQRSGAKLYMGKDDGCEKRENLVIGNDIAFYQHAETVLQAEKTIALKMSWIVFSKSSID